MQAEVTGVYIIIGLEGHHRDFDFYFKWNWEPVESFE